MSRKEEINEANFINLANNCVGYGLLPTGEANFALAQDYAKIIAVGFSEWMGEEGNPFVMLENGRWCQACGNSTTWTTDQLFEQYIQSLTK